MQIKGVDVSSWQKNIDYKLLKENGIRFVIIRAGYGTVEDSGLATHVEGCLENDIDFGYYWYSYADSIPDVQEEAAACLKALAQYPAPSYPVFFDMEGKQQIQRLDNAERTDIAIEFCGAVNSGGYPCGIYTNPAWLESYYEKNRIIGSLDIWLAHWTNSPSNQSRYKYGQTMWQWGIDKIGMDVDGDICFVDYPSITKTWYEAHAASDAPNRSEKTVTELAEEVIRGEWGNGEERRSRLTAAGYDYAAVQRRVNEMLT